MSIILALAGFIAAHPIEIANTIFMGPPLIISIASAIAAITPGTKDDAVVGAVGKAWNKIRPVVDAFALNLKNAGGKQDVLALVEGSVARAVAGALAQTAPVSAPEASSAPDAGSPTQAPALTPAGGTAAATPSLAAADATASPAPTA